MYDVFFYCYMILKAGLLVYWALHMLYIDSTNVLDIFVQLNSLMYCHQGTDASCICGFQFCLIA